jgi:hypothetical protein
LLWSFSPVFTSVCNMWTSCFFIEFGTTTVYFSLSIK